MGINLPTLYTLHMCDFCRAFVYISGWESHALVVGPVRLANNRTYISYGLPPSPENSTVECPYQLEAGDGGLQSVEWNLLDGDQSVGTFEWRTNGEIRGEWKSRLAGPYFIVSRRSTCRCKPFPYFFVHAVKIFESQ